MPKSLREELLELIRLRFQRITLVNRYQTNLGLHVRYGPWPEPVPKTLPALAFADSLEEAAPAWGPNARSIVLTVVAYDRTRSVEDLTLGNRLFADVDTAFYRNHQTNALDWSFEDRVQKLVFESVNSLTFPGTIALAGIAARYRLIYRPVLGDIYTA